MATPLPVSTANGPQQISSQISQLKASGKTAEEIERDGNGTQDVNENSNGNGLDSSRATTSTSAATQNSAVPSGSGNSVGRITNLGGLVPAPADTSGRGPEPPEPTPQAGHDKEDKPEDKNSLSSTTLTGAHNTQQSRSGPRKTHKPSNSDGAIPSTSQRNGKVKALSTRSSKPSFLSRILAKLVPCIGSSSRAHNIEIDEPDLKPKPDAGAAASENEKSVPKAKEPVVDTVTTEERLTDKPKEDSSEPLASNEASKQMPHTALPPLLVVPPSPLNPEVIVPPSPKTHFTSKEDDPLGVTAGSVQPPGSTGQGVTDVPGDETDTHEHGRGTVDGDGDESDGTSFEDDVDPMEAEEDDEDRLIMNGGAGIPIGPDGTPRPLLPPVAPQLAGRKCLVLDLDETLVHSSFKSIAQADYVVPVEIEYHWHNVYVIKRPGVDNFLKKMGEIYEVVVFTASLSKYADPVLDKLDIHQVVSHRLFRESCYNHKGNYVKDLSQLGRPIADTIILDNSPASYIFHPNNAVPVSSWFNDPHDTELTDLVPFLTDLGATDDVRGILDGGV